MLDDARAIERAGAFAVVLEGIPTQLAQRIAQTISIPTIGIGAGDVTDGQILVAQDMLGMYGELSPKFVRRYANIGQQITQAISAYIADVQSGDFPNNDTEGYTMDSTQLEGLH